VTPLALPEDAKRRRIDPANRHEQAKGGKERAEEQQHACHAVVQALRHVCLREKVVGIRVQREPFHAKGERAGTFPTGTRFSKHQLWHVEIEFAEAVSGPPPQHGRLARPMLPRATPSEMAAIFCATMCCKKCSAAGCLCRWRWRRKARICCCASGWPYQARCCWAGRCISAAACSLHARTLTK